MFQSLADTIEYPQIPINQLVPYKNHKFPIYTGEKIDELVESIKLHGIISAVVVRNILGTAEYEILSGHNRTEAAKLAGLETVPCYVVDVNDDEAELIVMETNLFQRSLEDLSYSARAEIISDWYQANKNQGCRSDLINHVLECEKRRNIEENETSCHSGTKLTTPEKLVEQFDLSKRNIFRYLRINQLIPGIKELLDSEQKFGFMAGVELSFLNRDSQEILLEIFRENDSIRCTAKQAETIKALATKGKLKTKEDFYDFLTGGEGQKKPGTRNFKVTLKQKFISQFFAPSMPKQNVDDAVEKAIILRQSTIPNLLSEYGSTEDPDSIAEKAIKFYLENHQ